MGRGGKCGPCGMGYIVDHANTAQCVACSAQTYQPLPSGEECLKCPYPTTNFASGKTSCDGVCLCASVTQQAVVFTVLSVMYVGAVLCIPWQKYFAPLLVATIGPAMDFFTDVAFVMDVPMYSVGFLVVGFIFISHGSLMMVYHLIREEASPYLLPFQSRAIFLTTYKVLSTAEYREMSCPGYVSDDGTVKKLIPFLSYDHHERLLYVVLEIMAWVLAIVGQTCVILLWAAPVFFYDVFFLPFWFFIGCLLMSCKAMCVGPVWNLWFRTWTLSWPMSKHDTDVVVDTKMLNRAMAYHFAFESLPMVIIQIANNNLLGTWNIISYLSISFSCYYAVDGLYRFLYWKALCPIGPRDPRALADIPVDFYGMFELEAASRGNTRNPNPLVVVDKPATFPVRAQELSINAVVPSASEVVNEQQMCVICMVGLKSVMMRPCNHICVCSSCNSQTQLINCPICRGRVEATESVFV